MVKNLRSGFTLAEVLTTLMIIGVVAAMTIPTLLNSTQDQQTRVALKKAASVLGQAVQLSVAKEIECSVTDSASLANCMGKMLSGTPQKAPEGDADAHDVGGDADVIVTPDGMAFKFIYNGDEDDDTERNLISICGEGNIIFTNDDDGWDGTNALCAVIVDINGLGKGTKYFFAQDGLDNGLQNGDEGNFAGTDQFAFVLTGDGIRPIGWTTSDTESHKNDAYYVMYGQAVNNGDEFEQ